MNWRWASVFIALTGLAEAILLGIKNYWLYVGSNGHILASDYSVFRFASVLLWRGDWVTLFDPSRFIAAHALYTDSPPLVAPFPYPPNGLWFIAPLAALPSMLGLLLWLVITFALFAWIVCRRTGIQSHRQRPCCWRRAA